MPSFDIDLKRIGGPVNSRQADITPRGARTSADGIPQGRRATASDFGADIGAAIQDGGAAIARIAEDKAKRDAATEVTDKFSQFQIEEMERFEEEKTGDKFESKKYLKGYNERMQQFAEGMDSGLSRDLFMQRATQFEPTLASKSIAFEVNQNKIARKTSLNNALDRYRKLAMDDETMLPTVLKQWKGDTDAAKETFAGDTADALYTAGRRQMYGDLFGNKLAQSPQAATEFMNANKDEFTADQLVKMRESIANFPNDQAKQIAMELNAIDNAAEFISKMEEVRGEFGPYSDIVLRDLQKAGLKQDAKMLALMDPTNDSESIEAVFAVNKQGREEVLADAKRRLSAADMKYSEFQAEVFDNMNDYYQAAAFSGMSSSNLNSLVETTQSIADYYVTQNIKPAEAAKKAVDWINSKYNYGQMNDASFMVPKTYDIDIVDSVAAAHLSMVPVDQIKLPQDIDDNLEPVNAEAYAENLADEGKWVTNNDHTGLALVDQDMIPVFFKNGERVEIFFDEIQQYGQKREEELRAAVQKISRAQTLRERDAAQNEYISIMKDKEGLFADVVVE